MASSQEIEYAKLEKIKNSPALELPFGEILNYDDPPNDNKLAIVVVAVSIAITTISVLIRVYAKVFCMRHVRVEDYLGLASFPFFIAGTWILTTVAGEAGYFVHQWNLKWRDFEGFIHSYVLLTTMYCVTLLLVKAAILVEWIHLFVANAGHNTFFKICRVMILANTCLYIATIIVSNFACSPRERIWSRYVPGTCVDTGAFNLFITSFHLLFNLMMLLLPHRIIWNLGLTSKQKIGVSVVFSVGVITCVCAAGRVVSAIELTRTHDLSYFYSRHIIWGLYETTTAEIVFCVPAFPIAFRSAKPLSRIKKLVPSKMTTYLSARNMASNSNRRNASSHKSRRGPTTYDSLWQEENSEVYLAQLEPARTQDKQPSDQFPETLDHYHGGILRTTEIDIRTYDSSVPMGLEIQRGEHLHPWERREL